MRMFIFYEVPWRTKLKTIMAPLMGTTTEAVMAPAVADCSKLGYQKLYRLLLDHVSHPTSTAASAFLLAELVEIPRLSSIIVLIMHAMQSLAVVPVNEPTCDCVTEQEGNCQGTASLD